MSKTLTALHTSQLSYLIFLSGGGDNGGDMVLCGGVDTSEGGCDMVLCAGGGACEGGGYVLCGDVDTI